MWLLVPAAGLLALISCLNGYLVYRKICDNTAAAERHQLHRSTKRQSSDLVLTVKQWTESSAGQLMVASTIVAVCLYISLDTRMQAHPEVLLPFLVISLCSVGGFLTYRFLAHAKMLESRSAGPAQQQQQPQQQQQQQQRHSFSYGDSAAEFVRVKWYDSWQRHSSRATTLLVVAVGLASFHQSIKAFSAGTQLIITSTLAIPSCCLAGFMMYISSLPQQTASSAEQMQQNNQKLLAGLGMLLAFTAGFLGLSSSMPVISIACFALPLCCLAGFWMYRYQLYCTSHPAPSSPRHTQASTAAQPQPSPCSLTVSPDHLASRERLRQNSDIFLAGHQTGARSPYASRHFQVCTHPSLPVLSRRGSPL